jgi:extracellular matrix regulatory protein A
MMIGFGNYVPWWRVTMILAPGGLPMRRLRQESNQKGLLVDAKHNRRTRAIIVTDSQHVILSGVAVETLQGRLAAARQKWEANNGSVALVSYTTLEDLQRRRHERDGQQGSSH